MRFPVTIRHRNSKAKIYAPRGKFAYYRLAYATAGKRRMQTFTNYSDAKAAAEHIVRDLANGSQAAALNATQSRDALAAFERLQGFFQASGRRVSLLAAVSDFVEASGKLGGRSGDELFPAPSIPKTIQRPGPLLKNFRPKWPRWPLDTRSNPCG